MNRDPGPNEELCNVVLHKCGGWQAVKMIGKDTKRSMGKFLAECLEYPDVRIEQWPLSKFRQEGFPCKCFKEATP